MPKVTIKEVAIKDQADCLLLAIKDQDRLLLELKDKIGKCQESKREYLDRLATKVKAGESTGDWVDDFLAVHPDLMARTDFVDGPVAKYVRELVAAVGQSEDQPLFVVHTEQKERFHIHYAADGKCQTHKHDLFPPPDPHYLHYDVDFGLLARPGLFFHLKVPAAYVYVKNWFRLVSHEEDIKPPPNTTRTDVGAGNQTFILPDLPPLDKLIMTKIYPGLDDHWEVVVGTKAVKAWLANCQDFYLKSGLQQWLISVGFTE